MPRRRAAGLMQKRRKSFLVSIFKKAAGCRSTQRKKPFKSKQKRPKVKEKLLLEKGGVEKERVTKKFKLFCPSFTLAIQKLRKKILNYNFLQRHLFWFTQEKYVLVLIFTSNLKKMLFVKKTTESANKQIPRIKEEHQKRKGKKVDENLE